MMIMAFHIYMRRAKQMLNLHSVICHAQDRLWQMELLRRVGSGQLAEILGEPAVKTDKFFRTIHSLETAKKANQRHLKPLPANDPMKKAALAYYAGINSFIKNGPTPVEFESIRY